MPFLDITVKSGVELSTRARQVCGMFDAPPEEKQSLTWQADIPIEDKNWNIGLIVGPSGCGKTTCARELWKDEFGYQPTWNGPTVIDSFDKSVTLEQMTKALASVGFNTVPAWLRPHAVLSNGEQFRANIAKRMLEQKGTIVIDEFTSVVDRQVAKIASHAVQKYVRREDRQLVAVTCHHDVIEWLQPDWIFEPAERKFQWRSPQRRPEINIEVARLPFEAWRLFAPYHYMSADLHKAARCFGLWCNGELAAFAGILHRPHAKAKNIKGVSRVVTLPDYQGLGLAFTLLETLGAAYKAVGMRFRNYPAHPSFVRAHKCPPWKLAKRAGTFTTKSAAKRGQKQSGSTLGSQRPCAVYEYIGEAMPTEDAVRLLNSAPK